MVNILGIGTAVGQTTLTSADFEQLGGRSAQNLLSSGHSRRSVLGRDYLFQTKNRQLDAVRQQGNQSPTDLAVAAALQALSEAKVQPEQLGLVIGDCPTPWQSTPSEGQRVADRLGLKVAAYDISGGGIVPLQLAVLNRWKRDRVAEYTLLVTTFTPTARMQFDSLSGEHVQFSDAAVACVISAKHPGRFRVVDADVQYNAGNNPASKAALSIDAFLPLAADLELLRTKLERLSDECTARAIFKNKLHGSNFAFACGEASVGMSQRIAERHDIARYCSTFAEHGQLLSAGALFGLCELDRSLASGERVLLTQALPGFVSGYAVLEVLS